MPAAGQELARQTPWGTPDLSGIWDYRTLTPLERPAELAGKKILSDEEAAQFQQQALDGGSADRRDGGSSSDIERAYNEFWYDRGDSLTADKRTSLITDPPDGRIPALTPAAEQQQTVRPGMGATASTDWPRPVRERVVFGSPAHGPEDVGLSERCILGFGSGPPILPSAYNNNLQIFQTRDYVVVFTELIHDARIVPLDGRPHLPQKIRQWLGNSRGYWDGDTLVVETTNFTDKTGSFNTVVQAIGTGETLHLIERFRLVEPGRLLYEFTIDDPTTFTRSFSASIPMKKSEGPLYEYACHEGNYGMEGLLAGARTVERKSENGSR
jgi:hypothetical protein